MNHDNEEEEIQRELKSKAEAMGLNPVPVETPEERAARELLERFPMESYKDTIRFILKGARGGNPLSLEVLGDITAFRQCRRGHHEYVMTTGELTGIEPSDIIFPIFIPAGLARQRAIEQDVAQKAAEAQAKQASQERAEADAKLVAKTRAETRADLASEFASWGVKGYKTWLRSRQEK